MSFDPNIARPSAGLGDTYIPLGSDGTPILRWELASKKAERAKARAAEDAEALARQLNRNQPIQATRYHKAGDGCA